MQSTDPGHFFQTQDFHIDAARREAKSTNENGKPIRLGSKALAIIPDPLTADKSDHRCVLVAESGGRVTRVNLRSGRVVTKFVGPDGPVTCLTVGRGPAVGEGTGVGTELRLYAGSWDKSIYAWPLRECDIPALTGGVDDGSEKEEKKEPAVTVQPVLTMAGHGDFVKTVEIVRFRNGVEYLVSGGSDTHLHVHNPVTGVEISSTRGHTRGIQCLAIDPVSSDIDSTNIASGGDNPFVVIVTGDSKRDILRWKFSADGTVTMLRSTGEDVTPASAVDPLVRHETSVYKIVFDDDGDMWTASADLSVKCLSRDDRFGEVTSWKHGQFVRDLLVHDEKGLVFVACDDEDVWVWRKAVSVVYHFLFFLPSLFSVYLDRRNRMIPY